MAPEPQERRSSEQTRDDTDLGWGDDLRVHGDSDDDGDAWLRSEVPPHHGD